MGGSEYAPPFLVFTVEILAENSFFSLYNDEYKMTKGGEFHGKKSMVCGFACE